jgi:hypothetical protein
MLEHDNIVIFSQPRTGTKLLAKILEDFGYHSFGEWYSLFSTKIENNKAIRKEDRILPSLALSEIKYHKTVEHIKRFNLYKNTNKSVITIWPDSLLEFPFMLNEYQTYHWACVKRDPWQQMLSWYISSKNYNFDGLKESKPVTFKLDAFRKTYWDYYKTDTLQNWVLENMSSTLIYFDELVNGKSDVFGKPYVVNSKDEHTNLEKLVENLDEVKTWFNAFDKKRLSGTDYFNDMR